MTPEERQAKIDRIRRFPGELRALVARLTEEQLNTRYLPDEWTVQLIVHHLPDSHMNSVIRLKLILTAKQPPLIGYDQEAWAELPDVEKSPIEASLSILDGLHERWCNLFESLTGDQWSRAGQHTEIGPVTVEDLLNIYDEHCDAHIDQIQRVLAAGGITQD